jgi:phage shock protein A
MGRFLPWIHPRRHYLLRSFPMGVFSRLSDIINSNINSMLDKAEDPEKIVRLIIQEMEDTLVEVRTNAARAIADRKEVTRKKDEFAVRANEWEAKAELAIAKGRDDLAKGAIAAKRKAEEMIELLNTELTAIEDAVGKSNGDLEKLQAKLKEARAKQRSLEVRRNVASDSVRVSRQVHDGRIDEALARFDRYERRIDELEAEAESWVLGRPRTLEDEFSELESEDAVNAELQELKQRVANRSSSAN